MFLTKKLLTQWGACKNGIVFCEKNKLFGFDLDRIDEIKGDYDAFIYWLRNEIPIKREYDSNGNVLWKDDNFYWVTYEYDKHGKKYKKIILIVGGLNGNMILTEIL